MLCLLVSLRGLFIGDAPRSEPINDEADGDPVNEAEWRIIPGPGLLGVLSDEWRVSPVERARDEAVGLVSEPRSSRPLLVP